MSGGTIVQWLALVLCLVFAVLRLPDAVRGRGRSIFAVLVLFCVAVGLSLSPVYLFVDGLLGGVNIANLIIRFSLYAIVLLLGVRCAAAFGSVRARRAILGPLGLAALVLTVIATVALFVASDLPTSSTGLSAYIGQPTVLWYSHVGRLYPAFVMACLLGPGIANVLDGSMRLLHRVAAALMSTGFAMVILHAALKLTGIRTGAADVLLAFGAIVLVTTGITLIWFSGKRSARARSSSLLSGSGSGSDRRARA